MTAEVLTRDVTIRYFAWVREKIGRGEERVALPVHIETVQELIGWQKSRGGEFESAFARADAIRIALDRVHVRPDARIGNAREIGFFPPVTGG